MTLSREARIGALVAISFLVLFAGFYYLKGSNLFTREKTYYAYYESANGITESSPVQIKGLSVGKVESIELENEGGNIGKVKLTLRVDNDLELKRGTVAKLKSTDLLGTKVISLEPGMQSGLIENKEVLPSDVEGGLIDNVSTEISPLLKKLDRVIATLDTALSDVLNEQSRRNLQGAIASFNATMSNFQGVSHGLNARTAEMQSLISNANSISQNLRNNNAQISGILHNAEQVTGKLSQAPIDQTFDNLNKVSMDLQQLVNKINSGNGSLGMIVNDKKLYTELTSTLNSLTRLSTDLRRNPSRYINISVFGKKDKTETITPETNVAP